MHQGQRQVLDHSSVEGLYNKHARDIVRYIHRYIFSNEDVDDLLVEVFLAAIEYRTLPKLNTEEQFAWLQRVARNKIVDYQRKVTRYTTVALDEMVDSPFDADPTTPEKAIVAQEETDLLRAHLSTLPNVQQQVLQLRFGEGLRTKEIASRLHKSDGAVRSLLLRSLNFLRERYNTQDKERING
jgi:RNA polymerase sigma factor (sigma-70 family)